MLGAVIIVIVLLVVMPVAMLIGGGVIAAIMGSALDADARARHKDSELVNLN